MQDVIAENNLYTISRMKRNELDIAVQWAAEEGWNPGLHDTDAFYATDPNGFLIGCLNGEPIASISVVKYNNSFGFLGFYIVKPDFRRKGYGLKIWNTGMEYLKGFNVGLDGVIAQQENYKKSGFRLAYRNIRFHGVAAGIISKNVIPMDKIPFSNMKSYDSNLFPAKRTRFLEKWINQPQGTALGIMDGSKLAGYGVIRKCRDGYKIGPLFADNYKNAEELLMSLTAGYHGETFYLDIPEVNGEAIKLAESNKMSIVFETARMYTGKFPEIEVNKIYGVTTFELG